eukprot:gene11797-11888_t
MKYLAFALPHLLVVALALWMYVRIRAMKQRQDALVKDLKGRHYWRINLARPAFFGRRMRLMAFEAKGVLIDDGEAFRVRGHWAKTGKAFESLVPKSGLKVEWLGNQSIKTGNIHWARLDTPKGQVLFTADTGWSAGPSREALCDIFRSAFPDYPLDEANTHDFALEKNPRSLGATVLFLGLMLFALLDSFVFSSYELTDAQLFSILSSPLTWLVASVGIAALVALCYRFFAAGRIPSRESMALALMLGAVSAGAALPVLKRVDQMLAGSVSEDHAYRLSGTYRLKPIDTTQGLPPLKFPRMRDYWEQWPDGSEHRIPLMHGPLGLWQLDHSKFDPPIVAFYEKKNSKPGKH